MATGAERERLAAAIGRIKGWLSDEEAEALFDRAKACTGRGAIVEIGSYRGRATIALALGSQAGSRVPVYAVDLHHEEQFRRFDRNVTRAGVGELITPLAGRSQELADEVREPLELLFIDGAQDADEFREDFERWVPKLVDGGWLAVQDATDSQGARPVADTIVLRSLHFRRARFVPDSMLVAQKVAGNTSLDRLRNAWVLAVKSIYAGAAKLEEPPEWLSGRFARGARRVLARL